MHVSSLYNGAQKFLPGLPRKSAHPHKLEEGLVGQVSISFLVAVCPDYDYFFLPPLKSHPINPDVSGPEEGFLPVRRAFMALLPLIC